MLPSSILPAVPTTLLTWTHSRVDLELFWFHQLENILSFFTSEVKFLFLKYLFDKLTLGTLSVWQTPSLRSRSLISQENTLGHSAFVLQKLILHFAKKLFTAQHLLFSSHLVFWDLFDHSWRGNPRFWATDLTGLDAASLVVPATNNYNVERQWKLQGVTSAQGKFYLVLRRKFHQSLV